MFRTVIVRPTRANLLVAISSSSRIVVASPSLRTSSYLLLRTLASGPSKPKPKESTPLRRAAAASQLIRSNPTSTRSEIQLVFTLSTAERYNSRILRDRLPSSAQSVHEAWWIPKYGKGEIFVFPENGSFVFWGLSKDEACVFAWRMLAPKGVQVGQLKEPETEELDFVTDPSEETRLQGDIIILGKGRSQTEAGDVVSSLPNSVFPQDTFMARYAFSQALSRSNSLSAIEASLREYLSSMANLPHNLEKTGKPGLGRRELIKKLGGLMKFSQCLNLSPDNLSDTPELYRTRRVLEGYFNSLSDALEIRARTQSVNEKIAHAAKLQSVLRQLLTETFALRGGLIVILFVTVPVFCLVSGPGLWNIMFPPENEDDGGPVETRDESSSSTGPKSGDPISKWWNLW